MARRICGLALTVLLALSPSHGLAQLLSPGRLAAAHEELEGLRNCTSCHQLGTSGISAERCLGCHTEVAARVRAGSGYHASVPVDSCADCHQDHLGTDFGLVRFAEDSFDHADMEYPLELSHAALDCRSCHEPGHVRDPLVVSRKVAPGALARTFLGLPTECAGCHREEDPHGEQFGNRTCASCHDAGEWKVPAAFDHTGTAFQLEGLHGRVACAECHGSGASARYSGVPFRSCGDCHADPHDGAMEGACARCHDAGGWHSLASAGIEGSFEHSRTSFPLRGAHADAECVACHRSGRPPSGELLRIVYRPGSATNAYPIPISETCASCHVDRHVFPNAARRWVRCADCHSEAKWAPPAYGLLGHEQSTFPLTGAHATAPCVACHQDPAQGHARFTLAIAAENCASCHAAADPHAGRYAGFACEACHTTEAFNVAAFDHEATDQACVGCHRADDPHGGQFEERDCATCHVTEQFAIPTFDHATTRFPLDGAHDDGECVSCHLPEGAGDSRIVRYRPLGTECTACHRSDR